MAIQPNGNPVKGTDFLEKFSSEVRKMIFINVAGAGKSEGAKMFCTSRSVSTTWRSHTDQYLLPIYWDKLRKTQLPSLQALVEQIDQECNLMKAEIERSPSNLVEKGSQISALFWRQFTRLTEELQKRGASISLDTPILSILPFQYEQKQGELDDSLVTVWGKIQEQINFNGVPAPEGAQEIRMWLNDPANAERIGQIISLDLSNLGLAVLPSEIGKLGNLTVLNLDGNQLTSLPETIGKLSNLRRLYLESNQLTSLPETIGKLSNLRRLYLESNQLTSLPETIGKLGNLTQLYLESNQLTSLPETIGKLSHLTVLNLANNQLTSFPETIDKLSKLRGLYLDGNQLTSLPETIGKLSKLRGLYLRDNQLTSLPETIGNLGNLIELNLYDNPLIFMFDKGLSKLKINLKIKEVLERYSACTHYKCQSQLAALCQVIHCGRDDKTLREGFEKLSELTKGLIHHAHSSSSSQLSGDLLVNRSFFTKAVITVLKEKSAALSQDQKKLVHSHVWNLAGKPTGENNWGENHAEDNMIRLIDALELTTGGDLLQ